MTQTDTPHGINPMIHEADAPALLPDFATSTILEKYGDVPLKFSGYYKYSFGFSGTAPDGAEITISIGGNHDEIYRYSVRPDTIETLRAHSWYVANVKLDGRIIYTRREY